MAGYFPSSQSVIRVGTGDWQVLATSVTVPRWAVVVAAVLVGLMIGSFLNVVIYRTPRHLSVVRPPSFCPHCGTPVRPLDNIPVVSWLALHGRCRFCSAPISARYPLVEAGTGTLFALVAAAAGPHWSVVGLCVAAASLCACAAMELDGQEPPPRVPEVGAALSVAALAAAAGVDRHWAHFIGAVIGVALSVALVPLLGWAADRAGRGGVGRGWVLLPAGAVLGWCGTVGAASGAGVLCLVLVVLLARRRGDGAVDAPSRRRWFELAGPAVATALAAGVAMVAAVGAGVGLG